jgi:hypothetical protein
MELALDAMSTVYARISTRNKATGSGMPKKSVAFSLHFVHISG